MQRLVCSVNVNKYRTVDFQQTLFNYLMFIILIISVNSLGKVLYKQLPICDIFILAHFKRGQDINDYESGLWFPQIHLPIKTVNQPRYLNLSQGA